MSTLGACGEDRLVAELTRALALGPDVRVGAGDDCAVIGARTAKRWRLLKADAVVEGIHFLASDAPRRVGWKALCRAISDVAAMGGRPEHALVTVAAGRELEVAWLKEFYAGLRRAARRFSVSIVGGETCRSPGPLFVNVALAGSVERRHCVLRSGGRPGDALFVTGRLGGSRAGRHLDFVPRLAEGQWLAGHSKIRAMMDLSDGLAADLPRLARASGCGFVLEQDRVPVSPGSDLAGALADGEDFELLFAVAPGSVRALEAAWPKAFPRLRLTRIGAFTRAAASANFNVHGYDHFAHS